MPCDGTSVRRARHGSVRLRAVLAAATLGGDESEGELSTQRVVVAVAVALAVAIGPASPAVSGRHDAR